MLYVQLQLIWKNKAHYCRLFFWRPLMWMFGLIGIISALHEFNDIESLEIFTTYVSDCFFNLPALSVVLLTFIVVAVITSWPKVKVSVTLADQTRIVVECCDIMKQAGLIVIQSTETFDTVLGGVIKENSVNGQFLKLCDAHGLDLDAAISEELGEPEVMRERHIVYPLGTLCPVKIGSNIYCLVAFTHWDEKRRNIHLSESEYQSFLKTLWPNLGDSRFKGDVINVAVLGNANLKNAKAYTTELRITSMIQTFLANPYNCCRELHICVHSKNVGDIDFSTFDATIRYLINAEKLREALQHNG